LQLKFIDDFIWKALLTGKKMGVLQNGQCEAGKTMDFLSGSRIMHTFRKLPTTAPTTKRKAGISQFVMEHNLFYRNE